MAYTVSITNDGGRVLVVVDGGDSDFSQSFDKGDLGIKVFEGSATLSLFKVATDETVCTFTKDTCIAPSAASTALLMTALNALLGAGPAASLPTGASTLSEQQTQSTQLESLKTKLDEVKALVGEVQASPTANTLLDRLKAIVGNGVGAALYYDVSEDDYLIGFFRDGADNAQNTIQYFSLTDPTTPVAPSGAVQHIDYRNLLAIQQISTQLGALSSPAAGSVNAQLAALNILTEAVALALTEPEPAIDDAFSIAAIATESSVWSPRGAKVITVQYATTLTGGGGTNDVKLQGSIGGSVWVDMDADNGIGDQAGVLNYNLYNGTGAAYSAVRIAITRYVNATAVVSGFIYAIR